MLARGQTPDLPIGQNLADDGGDGSYSDVALRLLTGQMFKRFERQLERVFKTFSLPLDAAIDLGVDTLRMQGIVNLTDRFEVAGETEIFLGSEDSDAVDDSQRARPRPATTGRACAAPLCSRTLGVGRRTCAVVTAVMRAGRCSSSCSISTGGCGRDDRLVYPLARCADARAHL